MPNPRQEINIKTDNARELSDGELEALIAQYAQTEKKKRDDEVKDVEKDLTKLKKIIKDA
jgi:hypothetical protein